MHPGTLGRRGITCFARVSLHSLKGWLRRRTQVKNDAALTGHMVALL
jgi:hypothetical protein